MTEVWRDVRQRFKNSVVQIMVTHGSYNIPEPYFPPKTRQGRGSGFLITREGHIITNAHVVGSMIGMTFRAESAGNKNLPVELIAVCPAKDVALLKVSQETLAELGDFEPMTFGDDHELQQTEPVLTIGYPLGRERIKFTAGVVSGYESPESEDGSASQSYIQIDATINPGNSGGPLVNTQGQVVGINSAGIPSFMAQATNFAIPSRVVLSILREMFSREGGDNPLIHPPSLGLSLHRVTEFHFEAMGVVDETLKDGMRVREIIPGCPFVDTPRDGSVEEGDILQIVEFADPYNLPEAFNVSTYRTGVCERCVAEVDTYVEVNRFGNVRLMLIRPDGDVEESLYSTSRKVTIQDVLDTIPIDTELTLQILRPKNAAEGCGHITAAFRNDQMPAIKNIFPPFDKLDYVIFGGAVWIQLSANVLNANEDKPSLCPFIPYKERAVPRILLSKLFTQTDLYDVEVFEASEILQSVNDLEVFSLDELRTVLEGLSDKYVTLKTSTGKEVTLELDRVIDQDMRTHEALNIRPTEFAQRFWTRGN